MILTLTLLLLASLLIIMGIARPIGPTRLLAALITAPVSHDRAARDFNSSP
jgi:hypothetical protein